MLVSTKNEVRCAHQTLFDTVAIAACEPFEWMVENNDPKMTCFESGQGIVNLWFSNN
jgi:hypothetical protein